MYDTYSSYTSSPDPSIPPDNNPWDYASPRVTGWRTGKPSSFTVIPDDVPAQDYDLEAHEIGMLEGGGHLYPYQSFRPPYDESGAGVRSYGRPPLDNNGDLWRMDDQGGAAARRTVSGSDVIADYGFSNKTQGEIAVYWQEPDDGYFRMGKNAYPQTNPPHSNSRAQARGTDAARASVSYRTAGAREKTYTWTPQTQDDMRPVSYRQTWGQYQRPFAPGRTAVTVATTMGMPDWGYYNNQPSPVGDRNIPPDASFTDYESAYDPASGYTSEDVLY